MNFHHRRLLTNILAVFSSTLVSRVLKFLLYVYAARVFGPEDYGRFSYVMVFALLSVIAMDLGVSRYIVQQLSKDDRLTSRYLGHNLVLNWVLGSAITLLISLYFLWFDPRPDMVFLAALLVAGSTLETVAGCYHAMFQSRQRMAAHSFLIAAGNSIAMLIGFSVVYYTRNLLAFAAIHVFSNMLNLLLSWGLARKRNIRADFHITRTIMGRLIRHGLPFSLTAAFIFIYYHIDSLFLEHYHGSESVGYYSAAYRLVEIPLVFLSSVTLALFPALSHLDAHDKTMLRTTTQESFQLAILFSLPGALAIMWEADAVTRLIFGHEYAASAKALEILVLSVAVIFPNAMLGTVLRGIGLQTRTMWITAAGAALNCGLNVLFIPRYGLQAAAATTVATECFIGLAYWHSLRPHVSLQIPAPWLIRILIVNTGLLLALWLCGELAILYSLSIAAVVAMALMHTTGLFRWGHLRKLFSRTPVKEKE